MINEDKVADEQREDDDWQVVVPPKNKEEREKAERDNFTNFKIADGCGGMCGGLG